MDGAALKQAAERLDRLLAQHAGDPAVQGLRDILSALIAAACVGQVAAPLDWRDVPGARSFEEGGLARYAELESAFGEFRIQLTGGESPVLRKLRAERGEA